MFGFESRRTAPFSDVTISLYTGLHGKNALFQTYSEAPARLEIVCVAATMTRTRTLHNFSRVYISKTSQLLAVLFKQLTPNLAIRFKQFYSKSLPFSEAMGH